jgi:hypothetical protein
MLDFYFRKKGNRLAPVAVRVEKPDVSGSSALQRLAFCLPLH